jgi:hypothetical protein
MGCRAGLPLAPVLVLDWSEEAGAAWVADWF